MGYGVDEKGEKMSKSKGNVIHIHFQSFTGMAQMRFDFGLLLKVIWDRILDALNKESQYRRIFSQSCGI